MATKGLIRWISIPAAAEILGCGQRAVHTLINSGQLTTRSIPGSFVRVPQHEVEALAEAYTKEPAGVA